ncbi:MAG: exodeoxyribonuclease VII large subunit [Alphaproteobacteria bacterium]|nr:exodeoxyribonuclease VII large subunit [Alphaproteobacteria bacterium]
METEQNPILTVTQISLSLKSCVEQVFSNIRVKGEVVGVKKAASGHIYFSLKDADSVLSAVCWRGKDKTTIAALEDGLEIVCTGKLSTYPGRSNYQMIVEKAEPAGIGALLKLLAERKEKLEKEGLFDESKKKKIPYLPETIGVVTSPSGAVIRDIMHRLNDRFPRQVYLWPVLVQGEGAAEQIASAIQGFNKIPQEGIDFQNKKLLRPDVLIVARGGGSFEDLWCFNEEIVVRAVAASDIPIISAVGHETDTTLIDYAADLRAPTPTGAAEKAVPVRSELILTLDQLKNRNLEALFRFINEKNLKLDALSKSMPRLNEIINLFFEKLDDKTERLANAVKTYYTGYENKLEFLSKLLKSYSYTSILERGFSLTLDKKGNIISTGKQAETIDTFFIKYSDKKVEVSPLKNQEKPSKKIKQQRNKNFQGNLFGE